MSKTASTPFFEADFTKLMDVSKLMEGFKSSPINMEAVIATGRRNVETLTSVGQATMESWQSLARRQAELTRQNMEQITGFVNAVLAAPSPEDKMVRQAEASKQAIDKYVANARDIAETLTKTNCQALEAVGNRISESLDEVRSLIKSAKAA